MGLDLGFAMLLTAPAGLFTSIGSATTFFIRQPKYSYLLFLLGLSAGVMVYISFDDILPMANRYGRECLVILGVIAGMGIMALSLWMLG